MLKASLTLTSGVEHRLILVSAIDGLALFSFTAFPAAGGTQR